jgi:hypothetical protein
MKILFIEDDEDKAKKILDFIKVDIPAAKVIRTKSFNGGLRALMEYSGSLNLVLLDMTMPSYDVTPEEPTGGSVEQFAGRDLLAQMQLRQIHVPTVVLTMFDSFGEGTKKVALSTLVSELRDKFAPDFLGHVYYNATEEGWRQALTEIIARNVVTK